jgi:hypothetical protein
LPLSSKRSSRASMRQVNAASEAGSALILQIGHSLDNLDN